MSVRLKAGDGSIYEIEESLLKHSELLSDLFTNNPYAEFINLPKVKPEILEKAIEFWSHYKDLLPSIIQRPLRTGDLQDAVPAWDCAFVELENDILFELIQAANYLKCKPLLDLTCAKLATLIKGKNVEELREEFIFTHKQNQ